VTQAGLHVVAAHPVHAGLRGSSPKNAAKDPISLDAILVCSKRNAGRPEELDIHAILDSTLHLAKTLSVAGMHISSSDRFVIAASQTLVNASAENLSFECMKSRLEEVRRQLNERTTQRLVMLTEPEQVSALA